MIDSHCHLELDPTFFDLQDVINKAKSAGINYLITNSANIADKEKTLEIVNENKGFVHACFGLHPFYSKSVSEKELDSYAEWLKEKNKEGLVKAIGEVGLDNVLVKLVSEKKNCTEAFSFFIDLSTELRLPLVIHCREAYAETTKLLGDLGAKNVVFHYFGAKDYTKYIMEQDWNISIPYTVSLSKRLNTIIDDANLSNVMAETDSPVKISGDKTVLPVDVKHVIEKMASIKQMPFEEMNQITDKNAINFYGLSTE